MTSEDIFLETVTFMVGISEHYIGLVIALNSIQHWYE